MYLQKRIQYWHVVVNDSMKSKCATDSGSLAGSGKMTRGARQQCGRGLLITGQPLPGARAQSRRQMVPKSAKDPLILHPSVPFLVYKGVPKCTEVYREPLNWRFPLSASLFHPLRSQRRNKSKNGPIPVRFRSDFHRRSFTHFQNCTISASTKRCGP